MIRRLLRWLDNNYGVLMTQLVELRRSGRVVAPSDADRPTIVQPVKRSCMQRGSEQATKLITSIKSAAACEWTVEEYRRFEASIDQHHSDLFPWTSTSPQALAGKLATFQAIAADVGTKTVPQCIARFIATFVVVVGDLYRRYKHVADATEQSHSANRHRKPATPAHHADAATQQEGHADEFTTSSAVDNAEQSTATASSPAGRGRGRGRGAVVTTGPISMLPQGLGHRPTQGVVPGASAIEAGGGGGGAEGKESTGSGTDDDEDGGRNGDGSWETEDDSDSNDDSGEEYDDDDDDVGAAATRGALADGPERGLRVVMERLDMTGVAMAAPRVLGIRCMCTRCGTPVEAAVAHNSNFRDWCKKCKSLIGVDMRVNMLHGDCHVASYVMICTHRT